MFGIEGETKLLEIVIDKQALRRRQCSNDCGRKARMEGDCFFLDRFIERPEKW